MRARLAIAAALAVVAAPAAAPAQTPTKTPGQLVVGVSMPAAGFQVGAVRGREVLFAKGYEIEVNYNGTQQLVYAKLPAGGTAVVVTV